MITTNKNFPGEQWRNVEFNFEFINDFRLEVSNFGRLRSFNKVSNGNLIRGSMINGYRIIRLKFYTPRSDQDQNSIDELNRSVLKLSRKIKNLKTEDADKNNINEAALQLNALKKKLKKKFAGTLKKRTIHYHALIHRLVAEYFLPKPQPEQTVVAHLDHDKLNNRVTNLKWMTREENFKHQQKSPNVIREKQNRKSLYNGNPRTAKLTVTKVMLLKKLLNEGKPVKRLVKQFKVTDTQILRIKRGENWSQIEAAK